MNHVGVIFTLIFLVILGKAIYLQVFCAKDLSKRAAEEYEKDQTSTGKRGSIFDRNGKEMAVTIDVTSVAVSPRKIDDKKKAAKALSIALNLDKSSVMEKLDTNRPFVWIKRHVSPKEVSTVQDLNITGINFVPETKRYYPNKTLGAQILGFTGLDGHGLEGLEFYYDDVLKERSEKSKVLKDARGMEFGYKKIEFTSGEEKGEIDNVVGKDGLNLILTLDQTIQYITESALKTYTEKAKAKSGIAVVMSPKTGAILALAHYPVFNPNAFGDFDKDTWRNRSVTDPFEPGSTMKIFTAAAGLESRKATVKSIFFCENGAYNIGRNTIHDTHPHGWLSLPQIVKFSSNIGVVKLGEAIGREYLHESFKKFGFGDKTGVDFPGESPGMLTNYEKWSNIDAGAIAFGQGVSVSAIQLLSAASAIANKGILMKPYIVQAITDNKGNFKKGFLPRKVRRVLSDDNAAIIMRIMEGVVTEEGTGMNASLENYRVSGKTGTAQKVDERGVYAKGKYVASFLGFAPAEDPEVGILVSIDEPEGNHYGGVVSAPAFKVIAQKTLEYLNVEPSPAGEKLEVEKNNGITIAQRKKE